MLVDSRTCKPLPNAAVDLWHCDAMGLYAGYTRVVPMGPPPGGNGGPQPDFDPSHWPPDGSASGRGSQTGPPRGFGPPPGMGITDKLTFLRGIQVSDAKGSVVFRTIVPGFYEMRTNHIHFKVRLGGHDAARPDGGSGRTYAAGHVSHVGQVFFPEELAVELMKHPPYSEHKIHRTTQREDMVFQGQHGLEATIIAAVDPTVTPALVGPDGPGGPGGPAGQGNTPAGPNR